MNEAQPITQRSPTSAVQATDRPVRVALAPSPFRAPSWYVVDGVRVLATSEARAVVMVRS